MLANTHPLNYINNLFYSSCHQAFTFSRLANYLTNDPSVQRALFFYISDLIPKKHIKLKELFCGSRPDRWQIITQLTTKSIWDVTLTDFSPNSLPNLKQLPNNSNFKFTTGLYNIFSTPKKLDEEKRYDIILTTYGFDSVWLSEDHYYKKVLWKWYKAEYVFPLNLPYNFPQPYSYDKLPTSLNYSIKELESFIPIVKYKAINIEKQPYGNFILNYYNYFPIMSLNVPGGLINKVKEFFKNQITKDGYMIIIDVATYNKESCFVKPYLTSGRVAKYRHLNFYLTQLILSNMGFNVSIMPLTNIVHRYGLPIITDEKSHYILQISKK